MEMKNIETQAEALAEKYNYLRKGLADFMKSWAGATDGIDTIQVQVGSLYSEDLGRSTALYLLTGETELKIHIGYCDFVNIDSDEYCWNALSPEKIREVVTNLPAALEVASEKIAKIDCEAEKARKIMAFLNIANDKK